MSGHGQALIQKKGELFFAFDELSANHYDNITILRKLPHLIE
jgi:hypothetical protein